MSLERSLFLAALMFYTRIPVPKNVAHSQQILNRSRKYFPTIGWIIGAIAALTFSLSSVFFDIGIAVALSMIATILATGAFHEDGFADTCDGLGGGWSTAQVLTIMKDSRVGTYAVVGLILLLGLKFLVLVDIASKHNAWMFGLVYICAHTLSRQLSSMNVDLFDYVQDIDNSKIKPITEADMAHGDTAISVAFCALPLVILTYLSPAAAIIGVLISLLVATKFMHYCQHRIGGYTGDILGAIQQLSELSFYLCLSALL